MGGDRGERNEEAKEPMERGGGREDIGERREEELGPEGSGSGLTERIWSPLLSSPLRSAGPPARMKDTKMPSPSSPPTMLKPSPVEPLCSTILRGSLYTQLR